MVFNFTTDYLCSFPLNFEKFHISICSANINCGAYYPQGVVSFQQKGLFIKFMVPFNLLNGKNEYLIRRDSIINL